ncbi:MAG: glycosyltransferase [Chloroflexota bacterium]
MYISIIIPAFNEEKFIARTIERIRQAFEKNTQDDLRWEIIVCDNNSTDNTAQIAAQSGANIVFEPINQISRARNTGASQAQGDWLLFIDADSYPTPILIAEIIALIGQGKHLGCGTTVSVEGGTLFNKLRMERLNPIFRALNVSGGAFILCRTTAFQAMQGFSTSLYAYEEVDFIIRLKHFGRRRNQKFIVLYQNPVITSGRKGDYTIFSMASLYVSNFAAVILFGLYYLLPKSVTAWLGRRLLGYWYHRSG